jgi:hypothetical protein
LGPTAAYLIDGMELRHTAPWHHRYYTSVQRSLTAVRCPFPGSELCEIENGSDAAFQLDDGFRAPIAG